MAATNIARLFQAFVSPAIFVSAAGLLLLSLNVRLMGIVSRLRDFQHRRHHATEAGQDEEAEAFTIQIKSIDQRAELVRNAMRFVLAGLAATILTCLLLGIGVYFRLADAVAVAIFVAGIVSMLVGTCYYLAEIHVSLSSVRDEAKYYHLMNAAEHHAAKQDAASEHLVG